MKKALLLLTISILFSCQNQAQTNKKKMETQTPILTETIYQFKVKDLYGKEFDFASLKGKKILVVNTASECGLTPQYKDLEAIYEKYKDLNFVIVGFPANNFGSQEPGSNDQIAKFCQLNYGVTFPMMSKISVKGSDMDKVYQFLTQKQKRFARQRSRMELPKIFNQRARRISKSIISKSIANRRSNCRLINGK